jgi:GTPase SAR1 family protein
MGCGKSKEQQPEIETVQTEHYDYKYQIYLVGPSDVGKASIITRWTENKFPAPEDFTYSKIAESEVARETPLRGKVLKIGKKGRTIRFDVQAIEADKKLYKHDYEGTLNPFRRNNYTKAIMVVFDLDSRASYKKAQEWVGLLIGENVGLIQGRTLLLGNKLDLIPEKRDAQLHVTKEEAETFVKSYSGVTYHEVSAKDGTNLDQVLNSIAEQTFLTFSRS